MGAMREAQAIAMREDVSLEGLAWFVRAAEAGSLSRAAAQARVSQSTVSRAIGKLEATTGVTLFHRSARSFSLTDAGASLLVLARDALGSIESFQQAASAGRGLERGAVRLSLCSSLGRHVLLPPLLAWAKERPGVNLDVRFEEHDVDPRAAAIDVVVRAGRPRDLDVMCTKLGEYGHALVASPTWAKKHGLVDDPTTLGELPTIAIRLERVWSTWVFLREAEQLRVVVHPSVSLTDAGALVDAACAGAGATVLPDYLAEPAIAERRLVRLARAWKLPRIPVFAFHAPRRRMPPLARQTLDVVRTALAGETGAG